MTMTRPSWKAQRLLGGPRPVRPGFAHLLLALLLTLVVAFGLGACGGGDSPAPAPAPRLVGEIIGTPAQVESSELATNAGYSGHLATSRALQAAGKQNLLDLLFLFQDAATGARDHRRLADGAEDKLARYAADNAALLTPGIRVLVMDEVFWAAPENSDAPAALQRELDALAAAVALVRARLPQARVGITVTPHAVTGRQNTRAAIERAIALVDWVGTDPYWFGNSADLPMLSAWTHSFPSLARQARPGVEVWLIAQAFKAPEWDTGPFNAHIAQQLAAAPVYDHLMFFGWQETSELPDAFAGRHFAPQTRALYAGYLK